MDEREAKAIDFGKILCEIKGTVRQVAKIKSVPKSTVHYYITKILRDADHNLYLKCREILEYNKSVRHIRGGQSTKKKIKKEVKSYAKIKTSCN